MAEILSSDAAEVAPAALSGDLRPGSMARFLSDGSMAGESNS